jgi:cytochrome P450
MDGTQKQHGTTRANVVLMAAATLPPIPKPNPIFGHFPAYGRDPLGFALRLSQEGGVVPIRMGPVPGIVVSDPAAIEEVLVTKNKDFRKSLATRRINVVTGDGILTSDGDTWRQHRRAVQPAFHSDRIRGWGDIMASETAATVETWHDNQTVDIHHEMYELTLRIVVRTLLAADIDEHEVKTVGNALAEGAQHFDSRFNGIAFFIPDFLPTAGNLRLRAAVKRIDRIVYRLIDERRAKPGEGDLISMLLEARSDADQPLTNKEIRDEIMTLFLAGHETTALALTWALYLLARNAAAQARLREELESVLKVGALPTVADIPRLPYTEAVVNETFRLYPPAYAVSREAIRPTTIGGHALKNRHLALVSIYAAHRNPERFPDPDEFKPERWFDGLARRLPKGAFVPFAEGPRKCIGASFAMQEAILSLATICSRVMVAPTTSAEPKLRPAVTLRPAEPVTLRISRRPLAA